MLNLLLFTLCHSTVVQVLGFEEAQQAKNNRQYTCGWVPEHPDVTAKALESTKKVQAYRAQNREAKGKDHNDGVFLAKENLPDKVSWEPLIRLFRGGLDPNVEQKGKLPRDQKDIGSCTANTAYAVIVLTQAIAFLREVANGAKPLDLLNRPDLAQLFGAIQNRIFYPDITTGYALGRSAKELNTPFEDSGAMVYTVLDYMVRLGAAEKEYFGKGRFVEIGLTDYGQKNDNGQFVHQTRTIALDSWMVPPNLGDMAEADQRFDNLQLVAERLEAVDEQIMSALTKGPVAFGTPVSKQVMQPTGQLKDYTPYPQPRDFKDERGNPFGGHAITLMGYDKNDPDELKATGGQSGLVFDVLNSWGDDYAKGGIVRFSGRYILEHGSEFSFLKSMKVATVDPTPGPTPTPPTPVPPTPTPPTPPLPNQDFSPVIRQIKDVISKIQDSFSNLKETQFGPQMITNITYLQRAIDNLNVAQDKRKAVENIQQAKQAMIQFSLILKQAGLRYTASYADTIVPFIQQLESALSRFKLEQTAASFNTETPSTIEEVLRTYGRAIEEELKQNRDSGIEIIHRLQRKLEEIIAKH